MQIFLLCLAAKLGCHKYEKHFLVPKHLKYGNQTFPIKSLQPTKWGEAKCVWCNQVVLVPNPMAQPWHAGGGWSWEEVYDGNWAGMGDLHTVAFNVEFCLYSTNVGPYVWLCITVCEAGSAGHSYRAPLLPPRTPIVLLHSISFIEADGKGTDGRWDLHVGQKSRHIALPMHCHLTLAPQCSTFT